MSSADAAQRNMLITITAIVLVSVALHVVPQALRAYVEPAWSMLLLMMLDALLIAVLARSWGPLRIALLLAVLLVLTVTLRQHAFAAAPSIVFNLLLAAGFGATLRPGGTPLLTRIAAAAYPRDISASFERYLRGLTFVWVAFFVAMAIASLLLTWLASFATWSLFVNVLTWPLTAMVFVAEWGYRRAFRRDLPAHTPLHILASIFSYRGPFGFGSGRVGIAAAARRAAPSE